MTSRIVASRYKIEEEIGRGGMAVVYKALDMRLNRPVAFKLLHPFLASQQESANRFLRESEAIAKLHQSNIVEIFDAGQDDESGSQFLVMELVEGPTLKEFIQKHPTKVPEMAIAMTCSLCDAIEHAHKAGIVHRDIKPENIMFSSDGVLKLMDFGIARMLDADRMTASGSLIGSPAHMSPEIIEGQHYTFSCDIFSLGTVLYYMLTNELPFQGATPMAVFKAILDNVYQLPSRRQLTISKNIDKVVAKCLKTNPDERYQTIAELKNALLDQLRPFKLENYAEIITKYYKDPDSYNAILIPKIKGTLNTSAQFAIRQHMLPVALENLNCVLAYDPDDETANYLLKNLRTGNVVKRGIIIGGLSAAAVAAIVLLLIFTPWREEVNADPETDNQTPQDTASASPKAPTVDTEADKAAVVASTDPVVPVQPDTPQAVPNTAMLDVMYDRIYDFVENTLIDDEQETLDSAIPTEVMPNAMVVAVNRPQRIKTPKKTQDTQPPAQPTPAAVATDTPKKPEPQDAEKISFTQPVFPYNAFAFINGKRYNADADGNLNLSLAPGNYRMTLTCEKKCVKKTVNLKVDPQMNHTTREAISLDWADGSIVVYAQDNPNVYFVARRLDDRSQRVFHLVAHTQTAVSGFNAFGKDIQLEVYAIPKSKTLKSYDAEALEQAKYASSRISIAPGESKTLRL